MRIGELAARTGVNVQTIRFYERQGLLKQPRRLASGYRDYSAAAVGIITFIKRNQKLGFTLKEIHQTLRAVAAGSRGALNRRADIERVIRRLDEQIYTLKATRDELAACLEACVCRDGESPCPGSEAVAEAMARA